MNNILRDGAYQSTAALINLLIAFGSTIIIARLLGPEGKGTITLVVQTALLGSTILSLGLSQSYQYYLGKEQITIEEVVGHILVQIMIIVILMTLFVSIGGGDVLRFLTKNSLKDHLLFVACSLLVLNTIVSYLSGTLMALNDGVKLVSKYSTISAILYGSGILLFAWLEWGILGVLVANIISVGIKILLMGQKILRCGFFRIRFNWFKNSKSLFMYGFTIMLGLFLMSGVLRIDTFIINALLGPKHLGIYSVAFTVAEVLLLIPRSLGIALFPQMNSAEKDDQIIMMAKTARVNFIIGSFMAIIFVILGFPAIVVLFGSNFKPAYFALLWILPGIIAMSVTYSYHYYFSSTGRPYILAAVYSLGIVSNVISNILLVSSMGINGAALSSSFTYIFISMIFISIITKQEKLPFREIFIPNKEDFQSLREILLKFFPRLRGYSSI